MTDESPAISRRSSRCSMTAVRADRPKRDPRGRERQRQRQRRLGAKLVEDELVERGVGGAA